MPRNPKKPQAKKSKKAPAKKPRAPANRNTNSVRVHIINSSGGDSAPPPYSGPDRSYFAFNPVFDMGGPKAQMLPPMNSGVPISDSPVRRVSEIQTQAGDGIFDRFVAGANPSISTGSGFDVGESSRGARKSKNKENREKMIAEAMNLGMQYDEATRLTDERLKKLLAKKSTSM
jgi:hypothetical protein